MLTETIPYTHEGTACEAYLALPARDGARPTILICHAWNGQSDYERGKAERIARELGLAAAAIDLYGKGVLGSNPIESSKLMMPFVKDRALLRRRLLAALEAVRAHPRVDRNRIAAIGFCFGGLCALDLARANADLLGVVSFHGLFNAPEGVEVARPIRPKVLILHGHDDPMATPEQLLAIQKELTDHGADWQAHVYGHAKHAFTNPTANDPTRGTVYDASADRRSWVAMVDFLSELFGPIP